MLKNYGWVIFLNRKIVYDVNSNSLAIKITTVVGEPVTWRGFILRKYSNYARFSGTIMAINLLVEMEFLMTIIKPKILPKFISLKLKIDEKLKANVDEYCCLADIKDISYFFTEAAEFVFSKDKKWQEHMRQKSAESKVSTISS